MAVGEEGGGRGRMDASGGTLGWHFTTLPTSHWHRLLCFRMKGRGAGRERERPGKEEKGRKEEWREEGERGEGGRGEDWLGEGIGRGIGRNERRRKSRGGDEREGERKAEGEGGGGGVRERASRCVSGLDVA